MKDYRNIQYTTEGHIAVIAINRPEMMNALNTATRSELSKAIEIANEDDDIRVVILTGLGKAFCAGPDFKDPRTDDYTIQQQIEQEYKPILMAMHEAPKYFITALNGSAAGAGAGLAMAGDLCIMSETANLFLAFVERGLVPDCGASWQLINVLGKKRTCELIATGAKLSAEECVEYGLANRAVKAEDLMEETMLLARQLAEKAPLALRYGKEVINKASEMSLSEAISLEAKMQHLAVNTEDFIEGRDAFLEKRKPVFQGR